jgi:DNA-directed RNA polymerase III subunit RPC6
MSSGGLSQFQEELSTRFLEALVNNPNGLRQSDLHIIGVRKSENLAMEDMVAVINHLIKTHKIKCWQKGHELSNPMFRIIDPEKLERIAGLTEPQIQVYEIIEDSGAMGIWIRDIKLALGISTAQVGKHLALLVQKALVKKISPVSSKSRKHYILSEFNASPTITGGPWYTDGDFDDSFVDGIEEIAKKYIKHEPQPLSAGDILARLKDSAIIQPDTMNLHDMEVMLNTMVFDGSIEEIPGSAVTDLGNKGAVKFRLCKPFKSPNHLAETPCGVCPVASQCFDGGDISPTKCVYMQEWLAEDYLQI